MYPDIAFQLLREISSNDIFYFHNSDSNQIIFYFERNKSVTNIFENIYRSFHDSWFYLKICDTLSNDWYLRIERFSESSKFRNILRVIIYFFFFYMSNIVTVSFSFTRSVKRAEKINFGKSKVPEAHCMNVLSSQHHLSPRLMYACVGKTFHLQHWIYVQVFILPEKYLI